MTLLVDFLIAISNLGCVLRFVYRTAFEGKGAMSKPRSYRWVRLRLDVWAAFGSSVGLLLLWWRTHWWMALAWSIVYGTIELKVTANGEQQYIAQITEVLQRAFPAMNREELNVEAMQNLDREKKLTMKRVSTCRCHGGRAA